MEAKAGEGGKPARTLFGHPAGLTVLFTTQTWAEFSFFGLQALLVQARRLPSSRSATGCSSRRARSSVYADDDPGCAYGVYTFPHRPFPTRTFSQFSGKFPSSSEFDLETGSRRTATRTILTHLQWIRSQ